MNRTQLHDMVWSTPIAKLSVRLGLSIAALKNTCIKFDVPVPSRGYWAKLKAGKPAIKAALPARSPGMSNEILLGGRNRYRYYPLSEEQLPGPLPDSPTFPDEIELFRDRIQEIIGKVQVGRVMNLHHPIISRLLEQDDARRQLASPYSWRQPVFDSPFEQRRLRFLNALFLALARCGGKPELRGKEAREITVNIHQITISLAFDRPKPGRRGSIQGESPRAGKAEPLRLAIVAGYEREEERAAWQDGEEGPLERRIAEIAVEIILAAELSYRESCVRQFEWRVQRKAQLEEKLRQRQLERERQERERQRRLEQNRIDRLLGEAASLRQATDIRAYVKAVQAIADEGKAPAEEVARRALWALAEADHIDPVKNGRFLRAAESEPVDADDTEQ